MVKIALCYARTDRAEADALFAWLIRHGMRPEEVFRDMDSLGESWASRVRILEPVMARARAAVLLLSPAACDDGRLNDARSVAKERGTPVVYAQIDADPQTPRRAARAFVDPAFREEEVLPLHDGAPGAEPHARLLDEMRRRGLLTRRSPQSARRAAPDLARRLQYGFVEPVNAALREDRRDGALRLLAAGALASDDIAFDLDAETREPHRFALLRAGLRAVDGPARVILQSGETAAQGLAFSPDGSRFLTYDHCAIRVRDSETGKERLRLEHDLSCVTHVTLSPDGGTICAAGGWGGARLWSAVDGAELGRVRGHETSIEHASFSPDGARLVTAGADRTARLWDVATGAEIAVLEGHGDAVRLALFSPDGARIATNCLCGVLKLWDAHTAREVACLPREMDETAVFRGEGFEGPLVFLSREEIERVGPVWGRRVPSRFWRAAFSPDGSVLATMRESGVLQFWSAADGAERARSRVEDRHGLGEAYAVAFSPDGARALTASGDATARLWNVRTGRALATLASHAGFVADAAFSPDGARVATAGADGFVRLWDAADGAQIARLGGHEHTVWKVAFSPNGRQLLSSGETTRLWDAAASLEIRRSADRRGEVRTAAFSPDGAREVSVSPEAVLVRDFRSGAVIRRLEECEAGFWSAAFSPDGARVVTTDNASSARIWDVATGAELLRIEGDGGGACFSPDGARIATAGDEIGIWDARSGAERLRVERICIGEPPSVSSVTFSPEGERLLTVDHGGVSQVWSAATGEELVRFETPDRGIDSSWGPDFAAFSPAGDRALSSGYCGIVWIWDARTGRILLELPGHGFRVNSANFSVDGRWIVTVDGAGVVRVWDTATGAELARMQDREPARFAAVSPDGAHLLVGSDGPELRAWDVRRLRAFDGDLAVYVAAALDRGLGRLGLHEGRFLLLRDAPEDLFAAWMEKLTPEQRAKVPDISRALREPLHPNCYLAPSQRTASGAAAKDDK